MIDSNLGRAAFRVGFYVTFVSGILSLLTAPSSAERIISIFTFILGILFLIVVAVLVRFGSRGE